MRPTVQWLKQQWSKSNIISGFLAIGIWSVIMYLSIMQIDVPPILASAGGAIIMYFYKVKTENGPK